jgi:hypothetical protein
MIPPGGTTATLHTHAQVRAGAAVQDEAPPSRPKSPDAALPPPPSVAQKEALAPVLQPAQVELIKAVGGGSTRPASPMGGSSVKAPSTSMRQRTHGDNDCPVAQSAWPQVWCGVLLFGVLRTSALTPCRPAMNTVTRRSPSGRPTTRQPRLRRWRSKSPSS